MLIILGRLLAIIVACTLAGYVAARAWHHRPARMFVLFASVLAINSVFAMATEVTP